MMPLRSIADSERPGLRTPRSCRIGGSSGSISRLLVGAVLVGCIVLVAVTFDAAKAEALLVWVQENKQQGSILFWVVYTAGVVLMLPAMVMAMASGAIFGLAFGSILAWTGSTVGQVIAFLIGRYLLRAVVLDYLSRQFPKWTAIDRAMATEGWKLVILLRLSPIAPWNVLNYGLSVTSIPLLSYTLASAVAILPYLILFSYFGSLARDLADIFTGNAGLDTNTTILMGIISGVVMIAVVWYTTHFSRKAISQALLSHSEDLPPELSNDVDVVALLGGNEPADTSLEMSHLSHAALPGGGGGGYHKASTVGSPSGGGSASAGSLARNNSHSLAPGPSNDDVGVPKSTSLSYLHAAGQHVSPRGRLGGGGSNSNTAGEETLHLVGSRAPRGVDGDGLHPRSGHSTPRSHSPGYGYRTNPQQPFS